jgi:hypothetical protein
MAASVPGAVVKGALERKVNVIKSCTHHILTIVCSFLARKYSAYDARLAVQ